MTKKKILIIEDEKPMARALELKLARAGFEATSASNGEDGLAILEKETFALILLDLIMPKMDGYQVCAHLKDDPQTRDIPVIMISAAGEKDIEKRCHSCGADDLILKPYESKELVVKIKALTRGGSNE